MKKIIFLLPLLLLLSCSDPCEENEQSKRLMEEFPIGTEIKFKINNQKGTVTGYNFCTNQVRTLIIKHNGGAEYYNADFNEIEPLVFEIIELN